VALAARGDAVLVLGVEAEVHFHPLVPEQLVNACRAAGFRVVYRGVIGDELVAEEYRRLFQDPMWGTMIRSTCPVVVERIRHDYPELVPYLAPVTTPLTAEAKYVRARLGDDVPIVHAGVCVADNPPGVEAVITFRDLAILLERRGVKPEAEPPYFERMPEVRQRHVSTAGGLPLPVLSVEPQTSRRFRKVRGLDSLGVLARAIAVDGMDLGFVDLLPCEGCLDHPLMGPTEELFRRRRIAEEAEPPRARLPVLDPDVMVGVGTSFEFVQNGKRPPKAEVEAVLDHIGRAPTGAPWDCGACGYRTCERFAEALLDERATFRQCPPFQERQAREARRRAAVDELTGLATYRVLRDRLAHEIARSDRSGESFGVLFIDLDRLKTLNDTYGHQVGNRVLEAVGKELGLAVRKTDLAARYGGDEFVVVVIATGLAGVHRVGESLRERLWQLGPRLGLGPGAVSVSIGGASYEPGLSARLDVLDAADRALYRAKGQGGNRVVMAEETA
jgi:diguanylate cyclase (GGDEF)-like protein